MKGLYAIADEETLRARGVSLEAYLEGLSTVPLAALQLRAKSVAASRRAELLKTCVDFAKLTGSPIFCNDDWELARDFGVGVHLGQGDASIAWVRERAPGLPIGLSTHNALEFETALLLRPTYVAVGPVFATKTKKNPEPTVGAAALAFTQLARTVGIPVVAIGGIDAENVASLRMRADAFAVISSIVPQDASASIIRGRACQLLAAWEAADDSV